MEVLCWIYCVWSFRECGCCVCDHSVHLSFFLHRFCLCVCMSEVISPFKSLRAGLQVFALLMLFLCVMLHTMWSGKRLQLLCIFPIGMLCLPAISLLVVSLHQSDPLSGTFFCDIVVNHEIIKRACLSQQRALEEMLHRLISFFTITRGVILICIFPLS